VQPKAGHMMMLEDPAAFCGIVDGIVREHVFG
jgi:pimeloyl-ACP methyl ester carboxylesterase